MASPKAQIAIADATSIAQAAAFLRSGDVVGVPTETVYGLAADVSNSSGVAKIFAAKRRPHFDPLIVHVAIADTSLARLHHLGVIDETALDLRSRETATRLMQHFWPGPLTILLPRGTAITDLVTSGLSHVAVRAPAHPVLQELLVALGHPIAAPSANLFGRVSPTLAQHVYDDLGDVIPLILDGGACSVGVESTIVQLVGDGSLVIVRQGGISATTLANAGFTVHLAAPDIVAPGSLAKHYAPSVPLLWLSDLPTALATLAPLPSVANVVLLTTDGTLDNAEDTVRTVLPAAELTVIHLSKNGDSLMAAQCMFKQMRALEKSGIAAMIVADVTSTGGLWPAIKDRLQKARNHWVMHDETD